MTTPFMNLFAFCSTAGKHRTKTGLGEDAGHLSSFVALDLYPPFFDGAAGTAGFLHYSCKLLLFRQPDTHKAFYHSNGLPAPAGFLPYDVHPATVLPRGFGFCGLAGNRGWSFTAR